MNVAVVNTGPGVTCPLAMLGLEPEIASGVPSGGLGMQRLAAGQQRQQRQHVKNG